MTAINANLTTGLDLTAAKRLPENVGVAFMGDTKGGAFDVSTEMAEEMLASPNPDGSSNADVVVPWVNSLDVTRRPRDMWIIDFGVGATEEQAALYEAPFEYAASRVKPVRERNRRDAYRLKWWLHVEPRPRMRAALAPLGRFLATPTVSKHRLFVWLDGATLSDHQLIVFARDDDYFFGVLHSRIHELWARAMGTQLREVESGFRYTPTTTFETFPFPRPTPEQESAVAEAAKTLVDLRRGWLFPKAASDADQRRRTLTNLYNEPPTWLRQTHESLDRAVYAAYRWSFPLSDSDVLERLSLLNLASASEPCSRAA